jgi:mannose-6-phosphate isomerase
VTPIGLEPNLPPRFFAGGSAIARWRGVPAPDRSAPEDWLASTTQLFGERDHGLTRLPDGSLLRDALDRDAESWLGPAHVERWGADPALLVKLLEAGQRLPVHCHPDRGFARRHLDCPYGKTEAWVVVEASGDRPVVHLGFRDDVTREELDDLVADQRTEAMLEAMNEVPVAAGDTVLVPAGLPHAIGTGVFVVELQEPTDLSVLMEWDGFDVDGRRDGHLGLGFDVALDAVDRSAWDAQRLAQLTAGRDPAADGVEVLFPPAADPYFRAERIVPAGGRVGLDPGFSVMTVLRGSGELRTEHGGTRPLGRGDVLLVPYLAGASTVVGELEVIRSRPPAPSSVPEA